MLLLIRHGETEWNRKGLIQGFSNIPLNENGLSQAQHLADRLHRDHPDIAHIYSSDLDRAHQTACPIAEKLGLSIIKTPLLRERGYGLAEGLDFNKRFAEYAELDKELEKKYPERRERWNYASIPEAEPYNVVLERVEQQLLEIVNNHPGEKVAVFAHGRVIKILMEEVLDSDDSPSISNCDVVRFSYFPSDGRILFKFINIEPFGER